MPVMQKGAIRAADAHDQTNVGARDHALQVGASGRGKVRAEPSPSPLVRPTGSQGDDSEPIAWDLLIQNQYR
jgi:hypothetical protein